MRVGGGDSVRPLHQFEAASNRICGREKAGRVEGRDEVKREPLRPTTTSVELLEGLIQLTTAAGNQSLLLQRALAPVTSCSSFSRSLPPLFTPLDGPSTACKELNSYLPLRLSAAPLVLLSLSLKAPPSFLITLRLPSTPYTIQASVYLSKVCRTTDDTFSRAHQSSGHFRRSKSAFKTTSTRLRPAFYSGE